MGKLDGSALRVPIAAGSITDLTLTLTKETNIAEIHDALEKAAKTSMKGILDIARRPLVSSDYI